MSTENNDNANKQTTVMQPEDVLRATTTDERVREQTKSTAHLTLPSLPSDRRFDASGACVDEELNAQALREREARLHENPPDDMVVRDNLTVKQLRDAASGEGVVDKRSVEFVDMTNHESASDVRTGATMLAVTHVKVDEKSADESLAHVDNVANASREASERSTSTQQTQDAQETDASTDESNA